MDRRPTPIGLARCLSTLLVSILAGCGRVDPVVPPPGDPPARDRNAAVDVADPFREPVARVVYLDQGWSPEESLRFYFTAQGSEIIPYSWFLALEQHDSEAPFRDNRNMARFRYLTQRPGPMNPDGLPVGFVKDVGRERPWLGLTCAACHTSQVDHEGVGYRIDGGPAQADVEGFLRALTAALIATRDRDDKFGRFAAKVLGAPPTPAQRAALKSDLAIVITRREGYNARNFPPDRPAGHGRVDALGAILNEVYHEALPPQDRTKNTTNAKPANAPVSYPFLWDTPQHDKVQYIGAAENGGFRNLGNLGRNVGEVLGVFGDLEVPESRLDVRYRSSVKVSNLEQLDRWLVTLWSPPWPDGFPRPDPAKVAAGRLLYDSHCLRCHDRIDRKDPARRVVAKMRSTGTDPLTADNFWGRRGKSGRFEGRFKKVFLPLSGRIEPEATGEVMLSHAVIGTIAGSAFAAPEDELSKIELGARERSRSAAVRLVLGATQYKARPLNGIWATAPYLHNGSVPNLDQLLRPAAQRDKSFRVGSRKFDPARVGFRTDGEGFFLFRTHDDDDRPIPGNSNAGHEYGTGLDDAQRGQLLEYLKTL